MNRKAASSTSVKSYYTRQIEKLEQDLEQRSREWRSLSEQNCSLRRKEELLFKSISTLGENLHFSALAAALELNRDIANKPCPKEVAECLAQDLQVYCLLHSVSKPELSSALAAESYTAQVLKDVITPERINEIRAASQEKHMQVFRDLTMRLAFHLTRHNQQQQRIAEELAAQREKQKKEKFKRIKKQLAEEAAQQQQQQQKQEAQQQQQQQSSSKTSQQQPAQAGNGGKSVALCSTLESAVDDYSRYIMLVSMTDYKGIQRMCYYSLETLEGATPPDGYWRDVMLEMSLTPNQMEQIRDAYERYQTKMTPLFARAQELGNQVRQVLLAVEAAMSDSSPSSSSGSFGNGGVGGAFTVTQHLLQQQQQPQQQHRDQEHSSQLPVAAACVEHAQHPEALLLQRQQQVQQQQLQHLQLQQQQRRLQRLQEKQQLQQPMDKGKHRSAQAHDEAPAANSDTAEAERSGCNAARKGVAGSLHSTGSGRVQAAQHESPVPSGGTSSGGSIKPWQEFGLPSTGLGVEAADKLTVLLTELEQNCNSMSQLSHGLTFPVWNMFDRLQLTKMVVASFPFLPNICQISNAVYWEVTDSGGGTPGAPKAYGTSRKQ